MAYFATLYSGSSGNCAVIAADCGKNAPFILVDMGKNCKQTLLSMGALGLNPDLLQAIFVTHEHSDHISGLKVFLKKHPVPVYGSPVTLQAIRQLQAVPEGTQLVEMEQAVRVAGFTVESFATSHDAADCHGYRIYGADGHCMAIATDLGKMEASVYQQLCNCQLVALECNYDPVMLQLGPYPYLLKQRIASAQGHLSNEDCAHTVADLAAAGCRRFALCHLSQENNTPDLARVSVSSYLEIDGRLTPMQLAGELQLQVSPRHSASPWMEF